MNKQLLLGATLLSLLASLLGGLLAGSLLGHSSPHFGAAGDPATTFNALVTTDANVASSIAGAFTITGASTLTGTSTVAASFDGFVAQAAYTMATGTAKAVYTNTHGPMFCDGSSGMVYVHTNGSFSPSLVFSVGTSTSATGYSTNLLASTTVATTTTNLINTLTSHFILGSNESIVGAISDITNTSASSTYYGNWDAQFAVHCWLIGG